LTFFGNNMGKYTNKLIEMAEDNELSWERIAREALCYMSESDVQHMAEFNYWIEEETNDHV
jgi:hypothetical protein